jgi:hypothetical protein
MVHSPSDRGLPKVIVKGLNLLLPSELHGFQTSAFSSANCLNMMGGLPVISKTVGAITSVYPALMI